jgi:pSer/pThr/pTyr-binding forkhead associated (FHA) protein/CRP-like cAMP-binding protein/Zn-dependent protease
VEDSAKSSPPAVGQPGSVGHAGTPAVDRPTPMRRQSLAWSDADGPHTLLLLDPETIIGRGSDVRIRLADPMASRHHAGVVINSGGARIRDLGAANGTFVNGERIATEASLKSGDVITVGHTDLTFDDVTASSPAADLESTLMRSQAMTRIIAAPAPSGPITLYLRAGPGSPATIEWDRTKPFNIGRDVANDLVLDNPMVSRHHAQLVGDGDTIFIIDMETANGTRVNDVPIHTWRVTQPGDAIRIGDAEFIYEPSDDTATATLSLAAGSQVGRTLSLDGDLPVVIGRDASSQIHLDDGKVSKQHARMTRLFGDHVLADLGSHNGTFVNDRRIDGPVVLQPHDVIRVGETVLAYDREPRAAAQPEASVTSGLSTLQQVKPFDQLEPGQLAAVEPLFTSVTFQEGDTIVRRPDTKHAADRDALYVILDGEATLVAAVKADWENAVELTRLTPADYCGERAAVYGHAFPHEVRALSQVKALRLTRKAYQEHIQVDYKLAGFFKNKLVPLGEVKYLRAVPLFSDLPPAAWEELAHAMKLRKFVAGEVIARRGEICQAFMLIASGKASAGTVREGQEKVLTYLEEGKFFGEEIAGSSEVYPMTVIAETPIEAFTLTKEQLETVRATYTSAPKALAAVMSPPEVPNSVTLHKVPPFDGLPPELITPLVGRLRRKRFDRGEVVVRQDERASAFYIVVSGSLEVRATGSDGNERVLNTLKPGQYFGELSLITDHPRNASVYAVEPCTVLALYRADFFTVLQQGKRYGAQGSLLESLSQRERPKRITEVEMVKHTTGKGEVSYILHSLQTDQYMSLPEEGIFLWDMMTGEYTLKDIAIAYSSKFHTFNVQSVFGTIIQLQQQGFLDIDPVRIIRLMYDFKLTRRQRLLLSLSKIFRWSKEFKHADGFVSRVHRVVGWLLFSKPVLAFFVLLTMAGILAYFHEVTSHSGALGITPVVALALFLASLVSAFLHEWGHALTVKQMGRRVIGTGFGWMIFFPYIYVNTTDMWMAGKWKRIAVTCAGPCVNIILGSAAAVASFLTADATLRTVLLQLATVNFLIVLANLNPTLPLDGYYLLMDWVEIPGLRQKALRFLGKAEFRRKKTRKWGREQRIYAVFGALIFGYMILLITQNGLLLQGYFHSVLSSIFGSVGAAAVAWLLALLAGALFILPVLREVSTVQES